MSDGSPCRMRINIDATERKAFQSPVEWDSQPELTIVPLVGYLPNDDADGDEEKESGEEDGEEDEEVDLQLILPEVNGSHEIGGPAADDKHVEAGRPKIVALLR